MKSMKFLDLFAGIGGFRLGLEEAGHQAVGWVEIDKYARKSYEAIHRPEGEWTAHDITTVSNESIRRLESEHGRIDIIAGGFPCQAFSIAGKRGGFEDTRGTLFFEICRFAQILKPKYLFLENVKGLLSNNGGRTFETILQTLDELGYDAEGQVLNSKDFGVPQHRERVFIVGHLRGERTRQVFPITGKSPKTSLKVDVSNKSPRQFSSGEGISYCLDANYFKGISSGGKSRRTHIIDVRAVLTPDRLKKRQNGRRMKEPGEPMFTDEVFYRVRKLTPRECWRLQGFPDWAFDRAKAAGVSDTQLYKQAGNSVTVPVIAEIAKRL